jgi:hypothetical protein
MGDFFGLKLRAAIPQIIALFLSSGLVHGDKGAMRFGFQ